MKEGAERICRRIEADARAKAEKISAEAAKKADIILSEAEKEAEKRREQILERAQKEAEEQKRRILGIARLDARKQMLAAKQELIKEALQQALEALMNLDEQDYFAVIKKMLLASIKTGEEVVILSPRDKARIPKNFWKEIQGELAAAGHKDKLLISKETFEISGGFILRSGGVEINNSFDSLLEMYRDELEMEAAAILFQEE
jgi:V/A-type H+-transporting ATPase subunit E